MTVNIETETENTLDFDSASVIRAVVEAAADYVKCPYEIQVNVLLTDDEAIVQMEMLGHSFFVYLGIDGETKVVYKRKNGYGLLICE